ncbi:hypothetical protein StoSoilB20_10040 [Arthrobacter sp. StoSoilB20]|nr:hypothetical protein StoSoilB20_10040 [Arthrobacter sp. StoSoilB20]
MFAADSLPEDEGILGANGDDQGKAGGKAEACGLEEVGVVHSSKLRLDVPLDQLMILMQHKMLLCRSFHQSSC